MENESFIAWLCHDVLEIEESNSTIEESKPMLESLNPYEAMSRLFDYSKLTRNLLFLSEDRCLLFYEGCISMSSIIIHTSQGHPLKNVNVFVPPGTSLADKWLRDFFVLLEFLVFKLVHIKQRNLCSSYMLNGGCNKDTFWDRIKTLRDCGIITKTEKNILSEIKKVRDLFAHSINAIGRIPYRDVHLKESFRRTACLEENSIKSFFLDDAYTISEKLIIYFKGIQKDQVDKRKFINGIKSIAENQHKLPVR